MAKDRARDLRRRFPYHSMNYLMKSTDEELGIRDEEPSDKRINPHYNTDTSSFKEGGASYGKR